MDKIRLRNKFNKGLYNLSKAFWFSLEPETAHNVALKIGRFLSNRNISRKPLRSLFHYSHPSLEQKILGIQFKNPIGLSAGFDKNADLVNVISNIGFGFIEVGSVTAKPSKGNAGQRLKRIKEKESLWVNLGLNNEGVRNIKKKIMGKKFDIPVGISIAKTNCKETADDNKGLDDYLESLKIIKNLGDYLTINISCPNAYGGQPFSNPLLYEKLLKGIAKLEIRKPIFVKFSPDLEKSQIDRILNISDKYSVSGFICSNLTKKSKKKSGGFSGKIVEHKSDSLLSYVYKKLRKKRRKYFLIGVGGVSSPEDAYKKIKLGANLVQLITGMIYKGPGLIGEINYGLVKLLEKDGYNNLSEAVGKDVNRSVVSRNYCTPI